MKQEVTHVTGVTGVTGVSLFRIVRSFVFRVKWLYEVDGFCLVKM